MANMSKPENGAIMKKIKVISICIGMLALIIIPNIKRTVVVYERSVAEEKPIDIIKNVASENDIDPVDMLAMAHLESLLGKLQTGDSGCSKGYFHINLCANPGARNVIGDVREEALWVANRLIGYGYLEDGGRTKAIAMYNAPARPNYKYAKNVEDRKQYVTKYVNK